MHRAQRRSGHRRGLFLDRRRPSPLQERAPGGGLSRLTPSEWSSGEKQSKGHITKAGNNRMRKLLVQVAVSILRLRSPRTEALRKWATGIAVWPGKKIAIVALARRM